MSAVVRRPCSDSYCEGGRDGDWRTPLPRLPRRQSRDTSAPASGSSGDGDPRTGEKGGIEQGPRVRTDLCPRGTQSELIWPLAMALEVLLLLDRSRFAQLDPGVGDRE